MAHEVKCADTVSILTEWNENLSIYRMTKSYNSAGIAEESWTLVEAFIGDWQPVSGATIRAEAGLSVRTSSRVIGPCNLDVEENDQIRKEDGTIEYVNFVQNFEDHTTIHLKRDEGSN
jgi:hypothetical protein